RLRHDQRQLRHQRDRPGDVEPVLVQPVRAGQRGGGGAAGGDRAGHGVQHPPVPTSGGGAMTTEVVGAKGGFRIGRWALHLVIAIILAKLLVSTMGTLINSFRTEAAVRFDGWWKALAPPYDFNRASYREVLARQGLDDAFINNLVVT